MATRYTIKGRDQITDDDVVLDRITKVVNVIDQYRWGVSKNDELILNDDSFPILATCYNEARARKIELEWSDSESTYKTVRVRIRYSYR